jgi:hypothetical protein
VIDEIFNNLKKQSLLAENLAVVKGNKTWEQISLHLHHILCDIDAPIGACKEKSDAFRAMVMRLQARKNHFLFNSTGYSVDEAVAKYDPNKILKNYYGTKLGKLAKSTYQGAGEYEWYKFWLLKDGSLVPVDYSHYNTLEAAGIKERDAYNAGIWRGHIDSSVNNSLNLQGIGKLNQKQVDALRNLFIKYRITKLIKDSPVTASLGATKYVNTPVASSKELEYRLLYGMDEAVATAGLSEPEQKLVKKFGRNKSLVLSTYAGEKWYKFYLLTDGTIIPVKHTHEDTASIAGTSGLDLLNSGSSRGYINPATNELNIDIYLDNTFSSEQITSIVNMYANSKYGIDKIALDISGEMDYIYSPIDSARELSNILRYKKVPRKYGTETLVRGIREKLIEGVYGSEYMSPDKLLNMVSQDVIGKPYREATREEAAIVRDELPKYNPMGRKWRPGEKEKLAKIDKEYAANERSVTTIPLQDKQGQNIVPSRTYNVLGELKHDDAIYYVTDVKIRGGEPLIIHQDLVTAVSEAATMTYSAVKNPTKC